MNTINSADDDNLRRIADALERIADVYAPKPKTVNTSITVTSDYVSSTNQLAATVTAAIKDAVRKGQLPKNAFGDAA